eukprot:scaffold1028_cov135-Cylindrotheca_fusiformis.AAC.23
MPTSTSEFSSRKVLESCAHSIRHFVCCQSYTNAQVIADDDSIYYKIRSPTHPPQWIDTSSEKNSVFDISRSRAVYSEIKPNRLFSASFERLRAAPSMETMSSDSYDSHETLQFGKDRVRPDFRTHWEAKSTTSSESIFRHPLYELNI